MKSGDNYQYIVSRIQEKVQAVRIKNKVSNHLSMFQVLLVISRSSSRYGSLLGSILRALSMLSLADVYSSCRNCVTAKLQKASSQPGSSRMAFQQFIAAFSGIPNEKQASARFLQKQCLRLYLRHFSSTTIDSEQRPSMFKAAALLLWRCRVTQNSQALSSIFSRMFSHTSRHSLAMPPSRQRQERYQAADKFQGECLRAALRSSMALSLLDLTASLNRQRELVSLDSRTITSSSTGLKGLELGMKLSVSSLSYSLTDGSSSSLCQTGLSVMPKPPPTLWFCISILRLFLKMGDCISSMCCLSEIVILTTLLVTTQFSLCGLGRGGAGIILLMSSATLMPFWNMDSKMLSAEPLLDETQNRLSTYLCFYTDLPLAGSVDSLIYIMGGGIVTGSTFTSCFSGDYFYYFSLSLEEKTVSRMFFFLSYNSFISLSLSCWLNFRSFKPSSIDDLLLLSLFARSSLLSLPPSSALGSLRVAGMVDDGLVAGYTVVNFLPNISLTKSLLGVLLFSLALISRLSLFFMREEDFMTSSNLLAYGFSSCAYFQDCLNCDWYRSRSRITDSNVSFSLLLRCGVGIGSASLRMGSLASSFAKASAASMTEAVHSTSAKQVWTSSFLKDSG